MRKIIVFIGIMLMVTSLAGTCWAESATKDECVAQCKKAAEFIQKNGIDKGIKTIGDKSGPFVWKDTYVFLMDMDANMVAHPMEPALTQKGPLIKTADKAGKQYIAEFIKVANGAGNGWVSYVYHKKGTDKLTNKSSYIERVPGTQYFVGAGVYE